MQEMASQVSCVLLMMLFRSIHCVVLEKSSLKPKLDLRYSGLLQQTQKHFLSFLSFFILIFFGHSCGIWTFPGQGSNLSCSWNPHHSCGNAVSLTHCARPGMEQVLPQRQRRVLNLLHHGRSTISFLTVVTFDKPAFMVLCFQQHPPA